ncbi:protealysin inhibitor emfourin [uncultured Jannaschia sp.]|uniref:protealysin inhibitor emfourin n=1 Tax=uncultured Jannaschia sp. TaxID=293347 RepID=UPI00262D20F3|nr:protealysin inhibitor emfourin [uncultured Jannaschia sp.]
MMIEVASSGGFGGIAAGGMSKQLDVTDPSSQQPYCETFDPDALSRLADKAGHPSAADLQTYTIAVTDDDNRRHVFRLREDALPPEMLDLIDAM